MKIAALMVPLLLLAPAPTPTDPQPRPHRVPAPRILVLYDMEGISGISRPIQVLYPSKEYQAARTFLTGDVNAAIRGLKAGGAGEIVVTDAHGSGNGDEPDMLIEKMDKRATFLFRDKPYDPYTDAMDASYQAIVCIGMHARANTPGFMAHTVTVEPAYKVNGTILNETTIVAISAARFGVPVIMVSGDNILREQIKEQFPNAEYGVVKTARGRANAELLPEATAQGNIEKAAKAAVAKMSSFKAYVMAKPFHFEISYLNKMQADLASTVGGLQRVDSLTLGFTTEDFVSGYEKSKPMTGMARMEELRLMVQAVQSRPDAKAIMGEFRTLLITNWLEPEKMPKPKAPAAQTKKRYYGDS